MSTDPVESSRGAGRARSDAASSAGLGGAPSAPGAAGLPGAAGPSASRRPDYGRDALGLVLLLLACFLGVAVVMAYIDPKEQASGMTGLVMALVETLGASAIFLAAGLGWIGFRLWIRGVDGKVGRDLFGVVITSLTLAVLVGALSPELGGRVGSVGALVSHRLTVFVGLIFGVIVVLLPAWFLWLRPAGLAAGELPRTSAPLAPRASDSSGVTQAEAEGLFPKAQPRPAPVKPPAAPSSPATAATRGPSAEDPFAEAPARRDTGPDLGKLSPPKVVAPSPYPPDVRREGRVPEGARPLDAAPSPFAPPRSSPPSAAPAVLPPTRPEPSRHEPTRPARAPAPDSRDDAALRARLAADAGVAGVAAELRRGVQPPVVDEGAGQRGAAHESALGRPGVAAGGHAPSAALSPAPAPALERELDEEPQTYADALASESSPATPSLAQPLERTPPKPSWEQPELFEEPVDAYGTPLSLVEKLRADAGDAPSVAAPETPAPWSDEELGDEAFEASVKPLATPAPELPMGAPEVDVVVGALETTEPELEPEPERASAAVPVVEAPAGARTESEDSIETLREGLRGFIDLRERVEAAAEDAHDEPLAAERAPETKAIAEAIAGAAVEHVEAPASAPPKPAPVIHTLFDEPAAASAPPQPSASEVVAAPSVAPAAEPELDAALEPGLDSSESTAALDTDVVLEPARRSKRKAKALRAEARERAAPSLESQPPTSDEVAAAGQAEAADESPAASRGETVPTSAAEPEPQVELTPAAPRPRTHVTVDEVVFKAGCLFIERQRVAVSMLQREFGLDFDAATTVLDQLQRVGLIGPYLGGQRRDILMAMDEWQELVAVE